MQNDRINVEMIWLNRLIDFQRDYLDIRQVLLMSVEMSTKPKNKLNIMMNWNLLTMYFIWPLTPAISFKQRSILRNGIGVVWTSPLMINDNRSREWIIFPSQAFSSIQSIELNHWSQQWRIYEENQWIFQWKILSWTLAGSFLNRFCWICMSLHISS